MSEQTAAQSALEPAGDSQPSGGGRHKRHRRHTAERNARRPEPAINLEELTELFALVTSYGFNEFELAREGFRVHLRRDAAPSVVAPPTPVAVPVAPVAAAPEPAPAPATPHPGAAAEKAASADESLHIIKSPIVGTFYRAASPTAEPFVKIGSKVAPDAVVCIIEAMKLMNEIQAETGGEVAKIYVENGQPVEFGQPLFGIKK
jgi:acetyl-CoA carboxylase biotin carboxyl carrier protein